MRPSRILLALGLSGLIIAGIATAAMADNPPAPEPKKEAKEAREKFAKLLLADGSEKKSDKAARRRGVVVNAFSSTRIIIH